MKQKNFYPILCMFIIGITLLHAYEIEFSRDMFKAEEGKFTKTAEEQFQKYKAEREKQIEEWEKKLKELEEKGISRDDIEYMQLQKHIDDTNGFLQLVEREREIFLNTNKEVYIDEAARFEEEISQAAQDAGELIQKIKREEEEIGIPDQPPLPKPAPKSWFMETFQPIIETEKNALFPKPTPEFKALNDARQYLYVKKALMNQGLSEISATEKLISAGYDLPTLLTNLDNALNTQLQKYKGDISTMRQQLDTLLTQPLPKTRADLERLKLQLEQVRDDIINLKTTKNALKQESINTQFLEEAKQNNPYYVLGIDREEVSAWPEQDVTIPTRFKDLDQSKQKAIIEATYQTLRRQRDPTNAITRAQESIKAQEQATEGFYYTRDIIEEHLKNVSDHAKALLTDLEVAHNELRYNKTGVDAKLDELEFWVDNSIENIELTRSQDTLNNMVRDLDAFRDTAEEQTQAASNQVTDAIMVGG